MCVLVCICALICVYVCSDICTLVCMCALISVYLYVCTDIMYVLVLQNSTNFCNDFVYIMFI